MNYRVLISLVVAISYLISCGRLPADPDIPVPKLDDVTVHAIQNIDGAATVNLKWFGTNNLSDPNSPRLQAISNATVLLYSFGTGLVNLQKAAPSSFSIPNAVLYESQGKFTPTNNDLVNLTIHLEDQPSISAVSKLPDFLPRQSIDSLNSAVRQINSTSFGNTPAYEYVIYSTLKNGRGVTRYFSLFISSAWHGTKEHSNISPTGWYKFNTNLPVQLDFIIPEVREEFGNSQNIFEHPYTILYFEWNSALIPELPLIVKAALPKDNIIYSARLADPVFRLIEVDKASFEFLRRFLIQQNTQGLAYAEPIRIDGNMKNAFGIFGFMRETIRFEIPLPEGSF